MIFNTIVSGGGGGSSKVPITLRTSNWIDNKQTITVEGVSADTAICYPCIEVDSAAYVECGISVAQGTNILTFTCQSIPTVDIPIKISIIYTTGGNSISPLSVQFTYSGAYDWFDDHSVRLLTSGTFISAIDMENVTVQVVGGGGGGGRSSVAASSPSDTVAGGGGGGAGYSALSREVAIVAGSEYSCVIGNGGAPGAAGGMSSAFEVSANGGSAGAGSGAGGAGSAVGGTCATGSWSDTGNGGAGTAGSIHIMGDSLLPTIGDGGGAGARSNGSGGSGQTYGGKGGSLNNAPGDGQPWTASGGGGGNWDYRGARGFGGSGGCGVIYISHEFLQRPVVE